jgi:hypothetical protein
MIVSLALRQELQIPHSPIPQEIGANDGQGKSPFGFLSNPTPYRSFFCSQPVMTDIQHNQTSDLW